MPDKEKNVVLNFKMDGQVKYAETLREINSVMNTAAKEYKNHIAAMGNDADATDKLRAEKKKLEIQMEGAQKRTKMLSAQYEAMSKDTKTTTGQLTQMYGKLLDAEKAEIALEKSLDRVNGGLSDQAQEARDAQNTLDGLKKENKLLDAEQKSLTSSFKLQNTELDENATEAEKVEKAQKQLKSQIDLSERSVANLEKQLESAKKIYGENSVEVMQLETKLNDARTTISKFNNSLDDVETSSDNAGDGLDELGKKMDLNNLLEATELLQGVSDKLLEIGQAAFDSSMEFGDSQTNLQANLGLTADEAESLNEVVDQVFRNGVVGSIDEATEAVILIKQSFEDLNNTELEDLTNNITTIAKRTGTDVQENVNAASRLMDEFGISGTEATDLIATGFQNGLNKSGDFLETLDEYSSHFETAGYSADEMLQIIKNGMENGSLNTDKAADAVKEFQVRLGDGSIEKSIENYSNETQGMFDKWKDGKATTAEVADSISQDLNKLTPNEQQAAISELASQFEDLGIDGAAALFNVGDAFEDVSGKAEKMSEKSPGEEWESSMRELQQSLLPVGQNLADGFAPFIEVLAKMGEWFGNLPGPVQTFITILGGLIAVVAALTPVVIALAAAGSALNIAWLPITAIILAVIAAIAGIVVVIQNWGAITDWISEKWNQFTTWLTEGVATLASTFANKFQEIKDGTVNKFNDLKDGTINKFNEMKDGAIGKVTDLKNKAGETIRGFKDNAVNKATELKDGFVNKVNELKDGAINRFNSLRDKAGQVMQTTKDKILSPIRSAKEKIGEIVDDIKGFFTGLGNSLKIKIPKPKLPHFSIKGKFDLVPPDISVPKIGIDWRAKGGIFTQPTIFGASGGRLQGAGEAGPEAVLPLNEKTLSQIGKAITDTMTNEGGGRDINISIEIPLDGQTIARKTIKYTARELYNKQRRLNRGSGFQ